MELPYPQDGFPLSWDDVMGWFALVPRLVWVIFATAIIVVAGLWLLSWVLPDRYAFRGVKDGVTAGPEARSVAVASPVLMGDDMEWNDILGVGLSQADRKRIVTTWDLTSVSRVMEVMETLLSEDRFGQRWHRILRARRSLALSLGRQPTRQEWTRASTRAGASKTEKAATREAIERVVRWEQLMYKISHRRVGHYVIRGDEIICDIGGYSIAQAAAITVWATGAGLLTADQAADLREQVITVQRQRFGSWREYGQSFLLGRAINAHHLTGGSPEKVKAILVPSILDIARLQSKRKRGPWTTIPW